MIEAEEISIQQVKNGYIIMPRNSAHQLISNDNIYVFQSFRELNYWLAEHFTHSNKNVISDE